MSSGISIELGHLPDGTLVLVSSMPFRYEIRRIEYYREQRLIMLVYEAPDHEGDLMHYELPEAAIDSIESNPSIMVVEHGPNKKLYGYDVPLIRVGEVATA